LNQVLNDSESEHHVPGNFLKDLEKLYCGNRLRNRRLYQVIGDIFNTFQAAQIEAMGLKDLQLAWEIYPDLGMRPMGDIDILIHPGDYRKAAKCLYALGFTPLPGSKIPFTLKYAWAHHFWRPSDNVWVDLQWNVIQREWDIYGEGNFDFEIDRVWRGARHMKIKDDKLLVPNPEDMLFHLCLHLEGHKYSELILFCDIAELLGYYNHHLDWNYLVEITKKYEAQSSVYYVLLLVQHMFGVSLPPYFLREIEPTYLQSSILEPLFENLIDLHLSLDEICMTASPPDEIMNKFEIVVRQQAAAAMQICKQIDHLVSVFINLSGSGIIIEGSSSEKIFPDPSLESFKELHLFIFNHDLPHLLQVLANCGYNAQRAGDKKTFIKKCKFVSVDSALAGHPIFMTIQVDIDKTPNSLFSTEDAKNTSRKDVATRLLKSKLGRRKYDDTCISIRVKVFALSPEDIFLHLSASLGREKLYRFYGLCSLLEFFRYNVYPLDWQQIARLADRYGVRRWVCEGVLMVRGLAGNSSVPLAAIDALGCSETPPRVLEWARYGPDSYLPYTGFKKAFLYIFSFLSIEGVNEKCRYLLRSLLGEAAKKPVLFGLIQKLVSSAVALIRHRRRRMQNLAYWIEPESVSEKDATDNS
jgi:hypothetical protein